MVKHLLVVAVAVVAVTSAGVAQSASSQSTDTGTLALQAAISVRYPQTACPAGTPFDVECYLRGSRSPTTIPGLGEVEESLAYFVQDSPSGCGAEQVRILPTTVTLRVRDKGEIRIQVPGTGCVDRIIPLPLRAEEAFTITGGSGKGSKTIRVPRRAKRVRVTYAVPAQDAVDGSVPASCEPGSGSWFLVGRTSVSCSAADTSGNASKASFVITVKRRA